MGRASDYNVGDLVCGVRRGVSNHSAPPEMVQPGQRRVIIIGGLLHLTEVGLHLYTHHVQPLVGRRA